MARDWKLLHAPGMVPTMATQLYLVQHGKAATEAEDPARPLTAEGREDVKRVAACVAKLNLTVLTICHSGKLRAKQTAELFAQILAPASIGEIGGLAPLDDPIGKIRVRS